MTAITTKIIGAVIGSAIFLGLGLAMAHAQAICG
jgi:hypothetical protein